VLRLMTLRSDDQFNTTIYSLDDRFSGIYGTRRVLLMNRATWSAWAGRRGAGRPRAPPSMTASCAHVPGLRVTPYDIPAGLRGRLLPRMQPADPAGAPCRKSKVPAAKAIPVRLRGVLPRPGRPQAVLRAHAGRRALNRRRDRRP
jgi:hypothetical protein